MHPNTHAIASRQVTSGSAVVLLELDELLLLELVSSDPVVDVEPAAGWNFSSESKQPAQGHTNATSAIVATSRPPARDRGDRAERARRLLAEAKDIGATVAAFGARDEPDPRRRLG